MGVREEPEHGPRPANERDAHLDSHEPRKWRLAIDTAGTFIDYVCRPDPVIGW
jgi:hypothetical protein